MPGILRSILKFKQYIHSIINDAKQSMYSMVSEVHDELEGDELEEMNLYLKKIMQSGEEYSGEYTLTSVKRHYHHMILHNSSEKNSVHPTSLK